MRITCKTNDGEELFDIEWNERRPTLVYAHVRVRATAQRWMSEGLLEWVKGSEGYVQRLTPPRHPEFPTRLRRFLYREHTGLEVRLDGK